MVTAIVGLAMQPLLAAEPTAQAGLPVVGTLARFPADAVAALGNRIKPAFAGDGREQVGGTLLGVPQRNELWQVFRTSTDESLPNAIAIRDMTTLKIVKTLNLALPIARASSQLEGGDWIHAFDGDKRIFFLSTSGNTWRVIEVDLRTHAQRTFTLGSPVVVGGQRNGTLGVASLDYDPHGNAILLLFAGLPSGSGAQVTTQLVRLDLATTQTTSRLIRTCNGALPPSEFGITSQLQGIIGAEYLYFACQRAGSVGAVVRIKRTDMLNAQSEEIIVAGPTYLETSFADPASGRIYLPTIAGEIWAFDTRTMAFVGVIAGGAEGQIRPRTAFGFDQSTGRLFFQSPQLGIGIGEGRFYPIPQARTYPTLAAEAQDRIYVDTKNGRIFVLTSPVSKRSDKYVIYDVGHAPVPPPPPDPDANTRDIEEQPGVTESRYFASGTGYGVRALLAKGITAIPPQPAVGQNAYLADPLAKNLNSKCGFTDRELLVGRVAKAEYDTGSTSAEAVGVEVDERTKLDLEHVSRCDLQAQNGNNRFEGLFSIFSTGPVVSPTHQPSPQEQAQRELLRQQCEAAQQELNPILGLSPEGEDGEEVDERECDSGKQWLTKNAYCTSSAGESDGRPTSENESPSSGSVDCPSPGGRLKAEAIGYLTGGLRVGKAHTETEISRLSNGSVVSKVVSEAQDIDIADVVRIGRITATAKSTSNGRPKSSPMSTYEFTIKGLTVKNPVSGETTVLCDEYKSSQKKDNCDIKSALDTLNTAAAGRAEFRLASGLDAALLNGTPKGALTAVQKSTARQASDQALVGDRTTEIAAFELTFYNDNKPFGRARQIYQFAGVSTAATYNIVVNPTGLGFSDDDGGGFDEDQFSATGSELDGFLPDVDDFPGGVPAANVTDRSGGGSIIERAVRALGRGIRMFFTNPRHALLLLTAWALFSLPPVLSRRRRLLAAVRSE